MKNSSSLIDTLIKDEVNGIPRHEVLILLGQTPLILQQHCNCPDLPIAILGKTISKACFEHGINDSVLKRLEDIINSPKGVYMSATRADSVIVLTFELQRNYPVVIPIRHSVKIGRDGLYNVVTSIYGKEGPNPEIKWSKDGLKLWPLTN